MKKKKYVSDVRTEGAGWEALANAVVKQAVVDYVNGGKFVEEDFKRFIYGDYFTLLTDVSPDYLFEKVRKIVDEKSSYHTRRQTIGEVDSSTD